MIYTLDIDYGFGQIGIETYPGSIAPHTDVQGAFHLDTSSPQTSRMNSFPVIADIDYSAARAEIGLPGVRDAATLWAQDARRHALMHIAQKSSAGDALAAIERGVTIADIVESETFGQNREINVDALPKTPPKVRFEMGSTRSDLSPGDTRVSVDKIPVTFDYRRYSVKTYMARDPYIQITAVSRENKMDMRI